VRGNRPRPAFLSSRREGKEPVALCQLDGRDDLCIHTSSLQFIIFSRVGSTHGSLTLAVHVSISRRHADRAAPGPPSGCLGSWPASPAMPLTSLHGNKSKQAEHCGPKSFKASKNFKASTNFHV